MWVITVPLGQCSPETHIPHPSVGRGQDAKYRPAYLKLMPPATDKPGSFMLGAIIVLIVFFLLAGFWLRYHKTAPTPSMKGTPVSPQ